MLKQNTKDYLMTFISFDHPRLIKETTKIVAEADGQVWEGLPNELKAQYGGVAGEVIGFFIDYVEECEQDA